MSRKHRKGWAEDWMRRMCNFCCYFCGSFWSEVLELLEQPWNKGSLEMEAGRVGANKACRWLLWTSQQMQVCISSCIRFINRRIVFQNSFLTPNRWWTPHDVFASQISVEVVAIQSGMLFQLCSTWSPHRPCQKKTCLAQVSKRETSCQIQREADFGFLKQLHQLGVSPHHEWQVLLSSHPRQSCFIVCWNCQTSGQDIQIFMDVHGCLGL